MKLTESKMKRLAHIIASLNPASEIKVGFKLNNHLCLKAESETLPFGREAIWLYTVNEGGYYVNDTHIRRNASETEILAALRKIKRMVSVEMEVYEYRKEIGDYVSGVDEPIC